MTDLPVSLRSGGLDETVLDPEPDEALTALDAAVGQAPAARRDAIAVVVSTWPTFLDGWARLGDAACDDVEAYACYRVGYHRGLDRLRRAGWRGSGYVRWVHPTNRGFLRGLAGLGRVATAIGEADEADRCLTFLHQLEPDWDRVGAQPGR